MAGRIEIDPAVAVVMDKPVIRGTRITVELILHNLAEGAVRRDMGDQMDAHPHLTPEGIRAGIAYGAASVAHGEVVVSSDSSARYH